MPQEPGRHLQNPDMHSPPLQSLGHLHMAPPISKQERLPRGQAISFMQPLHSAIHANHPWTANHLWTANAMDCQPSMDCLGDTQYHSGKHLLCRPNGTVRNTINRQLHSLSAPSKQLVFGLHVTPNAVVDIYRYVVVDIVVDIYSILQSCAGPPSQYITHALVVAATLPTAYLCCRIDNRMRRPHASGRPYFHYHISIHVNDNLLITSI